MIVTVGNTKGGCGKTSLALNLVIARAIAGHNVWLIDGDRQGTAQTAITVRAEAGRTPRIACTQYADGSILQSQVQKIGNKFKDIIIDAGGRDSTALRAALVLSDVVVVPFAPRSLDVWALSDICSLIDEARLIRDGLRAVAVLNNADAAGQDNEDAIEALAEFHQLEYLHTPIRRRKAVANGAGKGMSVLELMPKDQKAIEEISALVDAVFILK